MPVLVFLHGLLGSKDDWKHVRHLLIKEGIESLALDLPAHGEAKNISVNNFEHCIAYLHRKIAENIGERDYILVGYSLGGRLALYYALQAKVDKSHLKGVIVEGANFGLMSEEEKQERWLNDKRWAKRFYSEPLDSVLEDWYQQAVFAQLNTQARSILIQERRLNNGECIAMMLKATSLAKQPYLGECLKQHINENKGPFKDFFYFCGQKDIKFQKVAQAHQISPVLITDAGHNAHKEQPKIFADKLINIIKKL